MLDLFRKRGLTSVIYGVIVVGMVAVFVIQFRPNAGQKTSTLKQACAVLVRGWCVTPKDHMAVYRLLIPRGQSGELLTGKARQMGLRRIAAEALVERELLMGEAERLGIHVTEQEVAEFLFDGYVHVSTPSDRPELTSQFPFIVNGRVDPRYLGGFRDSKTKKFDEKVYERTIRNLLGRSPVEFHEEQAREITAAKVRDLVRAPIRVSEVEALDAFLRERSNASITHVALKLAYATKYLVDATPAAVETWLKEKTNQDLLETTLKDQKDADQPKAGHIRHILVRVDAGATDADRLKALETVADAYRRVRAGELFAEVAKEVSQDYGSGAKGGDVGDKTDGFVSAFRKAADGLKAGEMTNAAIETPFGFHILKKDDPARNRDDVTRALFVRVRAYAAAKSLAEGVMFALLSMAPEDAVASQLARSGRSVMLPAFPAIRLPAAAPEDGGAPVDAGAPLAPLVARAVTAQDDPERPRAETSPSFSRGGDPISGAPPEVNQKVLEFAFGDAHEKQVLDEPLATPTAFYAVQLHDRKAATKEDFMKEKGTYMAQLLAAKQMEALAVYVRRLKDGAKNEFSIDEQYMAEPGSKDGGVPSPDDEE